MARHLILALFVSLAAASTFAQHNVGGGDIGNERDNVWFLDDTPVNYCIERAPDFPLNDEQLKGLAKESFDDWLTFFRKYGLDQLAFGHEGAFPDNLEHRIALHFRLAPNCDQPMKQLKLLFGISSELIRSARVDAETSLGVAVRHPTTNEDLSVGGDVWIAKRLTDRSRIKHLLLHELGHVFGMRHGSTWVMDARIGKMLLLPGGGYGKIESPTWTYDMLPGETVWLTAKGRLSPEMPLDYWPNSRFPEEFCRDLGIDRAGYHQLSLQYLGVVSGRRLFTLFVKDFSGKSFELPGDFGDINDTHLTLGGPGLYRKWRLGSGNEATERSYFVTLDMRRFALPALGFFKFGDHSYASRITNDGDVALQMQFPEMSTSFDSRLGFAYFR